MVVTSHVHGIIMKVRNNERITREPLFHDAIPVNKASASLHPIEQMAIVQQLMTTALLIYILPNDAGAIHRI